MIIMNIDIYFYCCWYYASTCDYCDYNGDYYGGNSVAVTV